MALRRHSVGTRMAPWWHYLMTLDWDADVTWLVIPTYKVRTKCKSAREEERKRVS